MKNQITVVLIENPQSMFHPRTLCPITTKSVNRGKNNCVDMSVLAENDFDVNAVPLGTKFVATFSNRYFPNSIKAEVDGLEGKEWNSHIISGGIRRNFICEPWLKRALKNSKLTIGDKFYYSIVRA
jgi:hypothetical protein